MSAANALRSVADVAPGLALVAVGVLASVAIHVGVGSLSQLVIAVVIGTLCGNLGVVRENMRPGLNVAAKRLMRFGVVLLGLRLSLGQIADLGVATLTVVIVTVVATFFGTQAVGRRMGLSPGFCLLVGTGFSICGLSAIAAVEEASGSSDEEVAAAIGLVTLCGTLAIFVAPWAAHLVGLSADQTGTWIGASVHDTAQVVAAASTAGAPIVAVAIAVKLTRVLLLAPIVTGVNIQRARRDSTRTVSGRRPSLVPLFVVGFLVCVLIRTSGVLSDGALDIAKSLETLVLTAAMFGLGTEVDVRRIRTLGVRPLLLGAVSWLGVALVSLTAVSITA